MRKGLVGEPAAPADSPVEAVETAHSIDALPHRVSVSGVHALLVSDVVAPLELIL
jgi:hypothetical protein